MSGHSVCVIVAGPRACGKTSLIASLKGEPFSETYQTSHGTKKSSHRCTLHGAPTKLHIYEVSPRLFESRSGLYMTKDVIMLVFDMTKLSTWHLVCQQYWPLISQRPASCFIILVANKVDDLATCEVDMRLVQEIATQWNVELVQTSAKTNWNVEQAFLKFSDVFPMEAYLNRPPESVLLIFPDSNVTQRPPWPKSPAARLRVLKIGTDRPSQAEKLPRVDLAGVVELQPLLTPYPVDGGLLSGALTPAQTLSTRTIPASASKPLVGFERAATGSDSTQSGNGSPQWGSHDATLEMPGVMHDKPPNCLTQSYAALAAGDSPVTIGMQSSQTQEFGHDDELTEKELHSQGISAPESLLGPSELNRCRTLTTDSLDDNSPLPFKRRSAPPPKKECTVLGMTSQHPVRQAAIHIAGHPYFDRFVILIVTINCIFLVLDSPLLDPESDEAQLYNVIAEVFTILFTLEMVCKIVAWGFVCIPGAYLRDAWNWLDLVVVTAGWIDVGLNAGANLSTLRAVRLLRPLRTMNNIPALKLVLDSLFGAIPMIVNVFVVSVIILSIFAIIGIQLFGGALRYRCVDLNGEIVPDAVNPDMPCGEVRICAAGLSCQITPFNPNFGVTNFDNIGGAAVTVFQITSFSGYTDIMAMVWASQGVGCIPYFISLVVIGGFFLLKLVIAVIYSKFNDNNTKERNAATERLQEEARIKDLAKERRKRRELRRKEMKLKLMSEKRRMSSLQVMAIPSPLSFPSDVASIGNTSNRNRRQSTPAFISLPPDLEQEVDSMAGQRRSLNFHTVEPVPSEMAVTSYESDIVSNHKLMPRVKRWVRKRFSTQVVLKESDKDRLDNIVAVDIKRILEPAQKFTLESYETAIELLQELKAKMQNAHFDMVTASRNRYHKSTFVKACRRIVIDERFHWYICILIIFNTIAMAAFNYEMSTFLSSLLDVSNILFTVCFAIEMFMKILGLGLFGYMTDAFNVFDGVVVTTSILELFLQGGSLGTLRAFRLLRIFKLVRTWKPFKRLLLNIYDSMRSIWNIFLILMLFMFIFAVVGRDLFAGKFTVHPNGNPVRVNFDSLGSSMIAVFQVFTQENWENVLYPGMQASGGVAAIYFVALNLIGCYVILNLFLAVLIDSFQQPRAFAIDETVSEKVERLNGLSRKENDEHLADQSLLHMAALMKVKGERVDEAQGTSAALLSSRRSSATNATADAIPPPATPSPSLDSLTSADNRPKLPIKHLRSGSDSAVVTPPHVVAEDASEKGPEVTKKGLLARAKDTFFAPKHKISPMQSRNVSFTEGRTPSPLLKNESVVKTPNTTAGEQSPSTSRAKLGAELRREASTKEKRRKVFEESLRSNTPGLEHAVPIARQNSMISFSSRESRTHAPEVKKNMFEEFFAVVRSEEKKQQQLYGHTILVRKAGRYAPFWISPEKTLFAFRSNHPVRVFAAKATKHFLFEAFILAVIIISSIMLAADEPGSTLDDQTTFLNTFNAVVTSIFCMEMLLKIVVHGFAAQDGAYLRDGWNVLDFCIVIVSLIDISVTDVNLSALKALRALRAIRPLRMVRQLEGLRIVVNSVIRAVPGTIEVCLVFGLTMVVFAILGTELFGARFGSCNDSTIFTRDLCVDSFIDPATSLQTARSWVNSRDNFDNFYQAMICLFHCATTDGWVDVMLHAVDSSEPWTTPKTDNNPSYALYFIVFLFVTNFFILNLFVSVVIEKFTDIRSEMDGSGLMTKEQKEWLSTLKEVLRATPKKVLAMPQNKLSLKLYKIVENPVFDYTIMVIVVLNILAMAVRYYDEPTDWAQIMEAINAAFTLLFAVELIMKLIAYGLRGYFSSLYNWADFLICLVTLGFLFLQIGISGAITSSIGINANVLRIFRVARIFRVLKSAKGLRTIFKTLFFSLPSLVNVGAFLLLIYFIFAILAMNLFYNIPNGANGAIDEFVNFRTFGRSMLVMFHLSTGEIWSSVMYACWDSPPGCSDTNTCGSDFAPVFFLVYILICAFVVVNVFIAVILENFENIDQEEYGGVKPNDLRKFTDLWVEYDPEATQFIRYEQLLDLAWRLPPPLGFRVATDLTQSSKGLTIESAEILRKIRDLDIPVTRDGLVSFSHVLKAFALRASPEGAVPTHVLAKLEHSLSKRKKHKNMSEKTVAEIIALEAINKRVRKYIMRQRRRKLRKELDGIAPEYREAYIRGRLMITS